MRLQILSMALAATALSPAASAQTVADYLSRIAAVDDSGPKLDAVLAINPDAAKEEAAAKAIKGALAGKAVLIKDNIEVAGPMATTAGSLALKDSVTGRDAPLVARLRKAGVVILGKTNLSEWANIRSSSSSSGWSAVGGQTKNPHAIDRTACGSSSGSGAAVAAGLAWAAIGTETDGSITCPASVNGIVGFKPTVGMVSRTHVVPISHSQDTAGPMTRSVADAALLLNALAGTDPADAATAEADKRKADFPSGLAAASLKGVRIGVMRKQAGSHPALLALFDKALADMKA
ncbi:MAG: amidase family protein, partial [Novosphingobium sp.]